MVLIFMGFVRTGEPKIKTCHTQDGFQMKTKLSIAITLALISAGLISGCGDNNEPAATGSQQEASKNNAAPMLKYIPADSPYFMASRETLSEEDAFAIFQRTQPTGSLDSDLDEMRDTLPQIQDDEVLYTLTTLLIALGEELVGVESLEDIHALGMKMSPQAAFYGLGILPVMRFELQDEEAFRKTLQRVLTKADITLGKATTNDTEYWVITPEGPLQVIMVIDDQQLLVSVVPQDASDELLAHVLGKTLPDSNIGDTDALVELEQRHDFTPYGAGLLSSSRLFDELSTPEHPGTLALMEAIDEEPLDLSTCQADIDRLTGRFPGLAMGMREYSTDRVELNFILKTDEGIVSDLRGLTTQVPGFGSSEGMASVGLNMNLPVLVQTIQKYAQELRENPFSCDGLQDLNNSWRDINMAINNPITMMIGPALSGFNVRLDDLKMVNGEPSVAGMLTLASQNPMALLSTVSAFMPELGALELAPGGEPQKIESMMLPPEAPALYAVMSDNALVLGADISDPAALQAGLEAPASERNLLAYGHLTGEFYQSLADIMEQSPSPELSSSDIESFKQFGDILNNMAYWVEVDDAGVEMSFSVELIAP